VAAASALFGPEPARLIASLVSPSPAARTSAPLPA
jgi:hypothetical protein